MSVLTWELYQLLPAFLTTSQVCFHCGATFKESENIGLHLCHIHPGIRMVTKRSHGPQAFFYTCCGRQAGTQGCLEADHNASPLEVADPYERLQQIRDFATMIVPKLLVRFITQPLQSSILHDSDKIRTSSLFIHTFAALEETERRTTECRITHTTQLPVYKMIFSDDDDDIVTKSFNLDEEARLLWQSSKESPLFIRLMALASNKNQKAHTDCENAWRARIGQQQEEEEENGCLFKEQPSLPFLIISRINKKLF